MESAVQKKTNHPIVYYRMPHEKEAWFLESESAAIEIDFLNTIPKKPGFILHPYTIRRSSKPYFIQADKHVKMPLEDIDKMAFDGNEIGKEVSSQSQQFSKNKEAYCESIEEAIKEIYSGGLQKVVLSRVLKIKNAPGNPLQLFHELCNKYPSAFVSLVYIPGNVLWITATPELLISANHTEIRTASLAGTKSVDNMDGWGYKEKIEQRIVTDYIHEILRKYCQNITISGTDEDIAGNVKHLKTSFSATLNTDLWNLVAALHPTPAVCGFPLDKAKQFIERIEGYDRHYYTGFLGPCNMNGSTSLFVNLRCAELLSNSANLYIGSGITKDSIPEKEWEETELKAKTLLFAFAETTNEKE